MGEPILSARGLTKSFPSGDRRIEVLRGVDLDVAAGESVSIRGESGSGKSTMLNLLAGLDAPDTGSLLWSGTPPTTERRASFLGIVFQSFYLIPELDALTKLLMDRPGNATELKTPGCLSAIDDIFRITASVRSNVAPSGSCANATRYSLSCVGTKPGGKSANHAPVRAMRQT